MKRIIAIFLVLSTIFSLISAYNPPSGAEKLFEYSSPNGLSGNMTVSGGALFYAGADSLIVNPALAAEEERVSLNLGYTFLHNYDKSNMEAGSAFQTGILIPFNMFVFSGYLNGTFLPFEKLNIGNSMSIKAGVAKEVTDKLDIGLSINFGFAWNKKLSWALGLNLGFNYYYGDFWIFKDFRYGVSILNLGKNYRLDSSLGINENKGSTHFPNIMTIKIGAAATLFSDEFFNIGIATDLSTSLFQNLIWDINAQVLFKDMILVSMGESINIRESIHNKWSVIPSVSIGVKIVQFLDRYEYFKSQKWEKSEIFVSTAYKNLYNSVNAYSAGANIKFGMDDKEPPVIEFLD